MFNGILDVLVIFYKIEKCVEWNLSISYSLLH